MYQLFPQNIGFLFSQDIYVQLLNNKILNGVTRKSKREYGAYVESFKSRHFKKESYEKHFKNYSFNFFCLFTFSQAYSQVKFGPKIGLNYQQ